MELKKKGLSMEEKCCLYCNHSMSADSVFDGSQMLVCFECAGKEGREIIVDDDSVCENYD